MNVCISSWFDSVSWDRVPGVKLLGKPFSASSYILLMLSAKGFTSLYCPVWVPESAWEAGEDTEPRAPGGVWKRGS